ncbi:MAG: hypothetical protein KY476_10055 [Planctomycetes bacterium]|nr:hypothetical protein [Planctomycetota bacterium]
MSHNVLRGIIHGNVIELEGDAGISDGEHVEVIVRRVVPQGREPGEGLLRTEGALANDPEWDTIMDEIQQSRKHERCPQWEDA